MDGFTYNNIFDTKGIEYIAILIFFAILIPFMVMLNKRVKTRREARKSLGILSPDQIRIPQGVFFTRNHTWAHLERSGVARIGLDDLLMHITGEVTVKLLKSPGEKVSRGELLAEINQDGKQLSIMAPVSGEITDFNQLLDEDPGILNEDPYRKGWIAKVRPTNWINEISACYLADEATRWSGRELTRYKDFLVNSVARLSPEPSGIILQDGGEIRDNSLADLPGDLWKDFEKNFLHHV